MAKFAFPQSCARVIQKKEFCLMIEFVALKKFQFNFDFIQYIRCICCRCKKEKAVFSKIWGKEFAFILLLNY